MSDSQRHTQPQSPLLRHGRALEKIHTSVPVDVIGGEKHISDEKVTALNDSVHPIPQVNVK